MGRRKRGRAVHGWLILDKSYDVGSTEAVSKVRWLFDAQKAGHAGTLDPLATGVLPIALGEATKTVPYVQDGLKTYRFTARWGEARATDDHEGDVTATSDVRPSREQIERILPDFRGEIDQVPPAFSAVHVNGARAYDLAREGKDVVLPPRRVLIEQLKLVDIPSADEAVFEAVTGKGTYVRSLVRDIAAALGTCGFVSSLRRVAVGPFHEDDAVTIHEMTGLDEEARLAPEDRDPARYEEYLLPVGAALARHPQVSVNRAEASRLANGGGVVLPLDRVAPLRAGNAGDIEPILAVEAEQDIALCRLEGMKLLPTKVFQLG